MTDYCIRKMTADDWDAVSAIYKQAVLEGKSTFRSDCPDYVLWDKQHHSDCRFVLETDGKTVGWCALSPASAIEAYHGVAEVSIYLDRDYRQRGLGSILLRYLCEKSEQQGYWCLYSAIFAENTASIALHEKCGFRKIGTREKIAKDRFGRWLDTVLFERRNGIR